MSMTLANVKNNCSNQEEDVEKRFNYFPPGYRFKPHDEELIDDYLRPKILNLPLPPNNIIDVDLYNYNPAQLVELYVSYGEGNWYCFTPRKKKYPNGSRPARAACDGYWKATGADKIIKSKEGVEIGRKKALVFYSGKALKGQKTECMMHEYKLSDPPILSNPSQDLMQLDEWILCKIYKNNASKKRTNLAPPSANIGTQELGLLPASNGPTFGIGSEHVEVPRTTLNGPTYVIGNQHVEVPNTTLNGPTFVTGSEHVEVSTLNGPTFVTGSQQVEVSALNVPTFVTGIQQVEVSTMNVPTFVTGSQQVEVSTLNGPTFVTGSQQVEPSTTLNGPSVVDAGSKEIGAVPVEDDFTAFINNMVLSNPLTIRQWDVELAEFP